VVHQFFTEIQNGTDFQNHNFNFNLVEQMTETTVNSTETTLNSTRPHPNNTVPFFCFTEKSTQCFDLLEAKWHQSPNKTLAYVTKKLNPGHKYKAFVKEPKRACCMKGMMAKSSLGSFAYYGDRQSGSYRAFGKTAKKM